MPAPEGEAGRGGGTADRHELQESRSVLWPVTSGPALPGTWGTSNLQLAAGAHNKKAPRPLKGSGAGWAGNKKTVRKALELMP